MLKLGGGFRLEEQTARISPGCRKVFLVHDGASNANRFRYVVAIGVGSVKMRSRSGIPQ